MESYIASFPETEAIPDWSLLTEPFGDRITIKYIFPSGQSYLEMDDETLGEFTKKYPDAKLEKIVRLD